MISSLGSTFLPSHCFDSRDDADEDDGVDPQFVEARLVAQLALLDLELPGDDGADLPTNGVGTMVAVRRPRPPSLRDVLPSTTAGRSNALAASIGVALGRHAHDRPQFLGCRDAMQGLETLLGVERRTCRAVFANVASESHLPPSGPLHRPVLRLTVRVLVLREQVEKPVRRGIVQQP